MPASLFSDKIKPYIKSFYEGAKHLPGMEDLAKQMTSSNEVNDFNFETLQINIQKHKRRWNTKIGRRYL